MQDEITDISLLFQAESYHVSYSLLAKKYESSSPIFDNILIQTKAIKSNYKGIKRGDVVEMRFTMMPYLTNENCHPTGFGAFERLSKNNKRQCVVFVCPSFPDRLEFILNRGLNPYFSLSCHKSKHSNLEIDGFSMESYIDTE